MQRKVWISSLMAANPNMNVLERLDLAKQSNHSFVTQMDYARLAPLVGTVVGVRAEEKAEAKSNAD